jgi:glycosyltransferase involved in cell wall biosynthesis
MRVPLMMNNPLVSVVIIFLNGEEFLREAIDSVLAQSYTDWELLLVDDGSTDGSTRIAREYAARDPSRIRYLEHPGHVNRGMSATRNLGIRHAHGEYVALLDADDVWLPHKLSEQVAILLEHPEVGMVCGASEYWYSWSGGANSKPDRIRQVVRLQDRVVAPPSMLPLVLSREEPSPCPSDLLIRRSVAEAVGGFEESFVGILQLYEDQAFLAKVQLHTRIYVSSRCWIRYRRHSNSCVSVVKRAGAQDIVRARYLKWLEEYLNRVHATDIMVREALRRELRPYRHPRWNEFLRRTAALHRRIRRKVKAFA